MDERERFWRAVEGGEGDVDDPAGGALAAALLASTRLDAPALDAALARVGALPDAWRPVEAIARVGRRTFSPGREALAEAEAALEALLARTPEGDPSWPRAAHALAAIALRLADAEGAERWAAAALAALDRDAIHRRSWVLDTLGTAFARTGAWREAALTYDATIALKRDAGDPVGVAVTAGNAGRVELDLGRPARALALAVEADATSLPALTRLRLATLALEATLAGASAEEAHARAAALAALLDDVDESHHLAGYAAVALARWEHARGDDPRPRLDRAARSLSLSLGAALLSYWRRLMDPGPEDDDAWLASLAPRFEDLGVCTLPEVLAHLHVAERAARHDRARAGRMLDALAERVAQSNNPLFFHWLDALGDEIDPRAAARRRLRRYLGPQAGALEETRRVEATIVFSDLVGFTRRSARLDPQAVMDTVRSVFELAGPAMLAHRVEPLQYLGDGLLGIALGDDHGARGLAFARALVARMARVSRVRAAYRDDDPELHRMNVRCGVASGPVVLGPIGNLVRTEHLAIGLTTNRAARLQSYAEPDEVVCDASLTDDGSLFSVTPKGLDPLHARRLFPVCSD